MQAGERQVAPTIEGIRRDHVARYEFAATLIADGATVIDFACGVGYGTRILADAGHPAWGYDIDPEALGYARAHYLTWNTAFARADGNNPPALPMVDAAVCFETIEHLEDPRPLLRALHASASQLIASVPNEEDFPWLQAPGVGTSFHFRHYTPAEFVDLLAECGWQLADFYRQNGPESEVEPVPKCEIWSGRTLIAVCKRGELPVAAEPENDPDAIPEHVAILGLGPSLDQFMEITKRLGGRSALCDEVWAINALGDLFACDLVFHMDDVRIQEIRAKARPQSNIAKMLHWIQRSKVPVMTSRAHEDYPALIEFPLEDVLNNLGHDYFNSTAAYAIAFAIHIGVKRLSLFGMDFTYPNVHDAEKGRACVEFWLGQAHARGIKIDLPQTTTLLDSMYPKAARLYGYDTLDVGFEPQPDGHLKLSFTPIEQLPTADEIERRYDHSTPIAKQSPAKKE